MGCNPSIENSRKNQKVKFQKVEQGETAPIQRKRFRDFNQKSQRLKDALVLRELNKILNRHDINNSIRS